MTTMLATVSTVAAMIDARVFAVLLANMPRVQSALEALAKRATRKGLPVPSWTWGATSTRDEEHAVRADVPGGFVLRTFRNVERIALTVAADPIRYAGWSFVAALSHLGADGNLVRTLPGEECPQRYRTAPGDCDHCRANRKRNETFVLRHDDGRVVQVGSTCIGDFLGGLDALKAAGRAEMLADLRRIAEEGADDMGGFGRTPSIFALDRFLAAVAYDVRAFGWMSRTQARERGGCATADNVWRRLTEGKPEKETAEDHALALASLDWARDLTDAALSRERSDYLHNVRTVARAGFANQKSAGIAASIVTAYQRAQASARQAADRAARPSSSAFVGTEGKRQSFGTVVLDFVTGYDTAYGHTTVLKFKNAEGCSIVWKASSTDLGRADVGKRYTLTGTVKKHDTYKGANQTIVTRCNVAEVRAEEPAPSSEPSDLDREPDSGMIEQAAC